MSDRHDDPANPGGHGGDSHGGGEREQAGTPAPSGFLRGAGVVAVAVVIGALVMPAGTRAPLRVTTASQSTPTTTSPSTTTPRSSSTTTTLATIVPGASSIHVLVVNGTSITNLAGGTSTYLRSRGFLTLPATNATTKVTGTQVYAVSGPSSSATEVTTALGLTASTIQPTTAVVPVRSAAGANVIVVAGPDLARLAPGSSPSTTGAPPN
ncbi:MAG TPA: LytR C-terminal domain-containing protein [Acidimicrobiales bacterium]